MDRGVIDLAAQAGKRLAKPRSVDRLRKRCGLAACARSARAILPRIASISASFAANFGSSSTRVSSSSHAKASARRSSCNIVFSIGKLRQTRSGSPSPDSGGVGEFSI
jgi:hypothetical protein